MPAAELALPAQVSPPQFALSPLRPEAIRGVDVLAYPVLPGVEASSDGAAGPGPLLGPGADEASETYGLDLLGFLTQLAGPVSGPADAGTVTEVPLVTGDGPRLILLVGVGDESPTAYRRAGAALARAGKDHDSVATSIASIADRDGFEAFVVGVMLGSFGFHWRSTGPKAQPLGKVVLAGHVDAGDRDGELQRAIATGGAAWLSRSLASVPSNLKNPEWLATQARDVARDHGLECTVWGERELAKHGMGGIIGVGQASVSPPRLIRLDYTPAKVRRGTPRIVLVGKGITFDTGGLSIKPAEPMVNMKRDMSGGGVVIAVLGALAAVGCPVRVTGLIASAENAVGADSMRPGDVVTHYGGRTSEVTNTDAEGRLVLADALAYAVDKLDPAALVDIATLTGAMKVALGETVGGLFADDETLATRLRDAGEAAGEPVWRFPLAAEYEEKLASKVADADNAPSGPGAITAALFLRHFTGDVPWAHLDIASVGDSRKDRFEWTEGPTGFGARLLLRWLGDPEPLRGIGAR